MGTYPEVLERTCILCKIRHLGHHEERSRDDPAADDEQFEELWKKLENEGILDDELLQIVWQPLLKVETKTTTIESFVHIMEKFSLLCHWPTEDKSKQYLVPSMLMHPPDDNATKLLASATFPSVFVRFRQPYIA